MDTKIIGIILLICAGLVFQYSYDDFMDSFFSPEVKLKTTIEKDINTSLAQEGEETKNNVSNIHHVKFVYRSTDALNFLKKHPPQFQTNKDGSIWLEVEVLDLQDNEAPGFITQISVFDIKSKNKISEFGQTYYYKDFDKDFKLRITEVSPTPTDKTSEHPENNESNNNDSKKDRSKEESKNTISSQNSETKTNPKAKPTKNSK